MRPLLTLVVTALAVQIGAGMATAQLLPQFGGVPAGGVTGIGVGLGSGSASLGLTFGQSSSRSISSQSASVTTLNGVPGFISSTVTRPFVTGFTPVVGGYPELRGYASEMAQSDREKLNRVQQSQQKLKNKSLEKYLRRAERAEQDGNKRMARANYQRAIAIAAEPLRSALKLRLREMLQREIR